jgi:porin
MKKSILCRTSVALAIAALLGLGLPSSAFAEDDDSGFSIGFDYTGDLFSNIDGGIETGSAYTGLGNVNFDFQGDAWSWHANVFVPHGESPTGELVGDFSVLSNIDIDGLKTRMAEFWFQRGFEGGSVRFGMLALDTEFWASENGGLFVNSVFGAPTIVSANLPNPSIFPTATLGVRAEWSVGETGLLRVAAVDGDAGDPEVDNRHGLDVVFGDGVLFAAEYQQDWTEENGLADMFKVGMFEHTGEFIDIENFDTASNSWGVYAILDKPVSDRVGWFGRVGFTRKSVAIAPWSMETGITIANAFGSNGTFGVGLAYVDINRGLRPILEVDVNNETIIELTYDYAFNEHFSLQPDLQYILNTGGFSEGGETLVVGVRGKLTF